MFHKLTRALTCLFIPQENFPQSTVIKWTPAVGKEPSDQIQRSGKI